MGAEIIKNLGTSEYVMWIYLKERNFVLPSLEEMTNHFGRHPRTIRCWLNKLKLHGYI